MDLPLAAQTAYAQLLETLQMHDMQRSVADAPGSFNRKEIKGKSYWYYQYRDLDSKLCQIYLGPESEALNALMHRRGQAGASVDEAQIKALAQSADTLGCMSVSNPHLVIIRRLADAGFFRAGGILVGTHAFLSAGNMLGVRWADSSRTQDLDFAHAGKSMQVALHSDAKLDLGDVIESLGMGFVPASSLQGVRGGRWVHPKEPGFVLDFLTPMDRTENELVHVKAFNAEFQALRFMEFSLEDIQTAAIFTRTQACLVNVPNPARMAVHKLIVSGLRPIAQRAKSNKDVKQAAALFDWHESHAPEDLQQALNDANSRGPAWRKALAAGIQSMEIV
ncbi:MAG: hypothetical protein HC765_03810 [Brachymonas sp.]|nr:hypothetical protein [Brachymonas sp.]